MGLRIGGGVGAAGFIKGYSKGVALDEALPKCLSKWKVLHVSSTLNSEWVSE